jgi:hypothetical protein
MTKSIYIAYSNIIHYIRFNVISKSAMIMHTFICALIFAELHACPQKQPCILWSFCWKRIYRYT